MPPVWDTLLRAALLARQSGASEIGLDELLAALEPESTPSESVQPESDQTFHPIPHQDFLFSSAAAKAVESAGDLQTMPVERLRTAVLAAKHQESI